MGIVQMTKEAKEAYDRFKKIKKTAKEYYQMAKNMIDEDTRSGELLKQGVKHLIKRAEKYSGLPISEHPYFKFHKIHLEVLGKVLVATDTARNALASMQKAVSSADTAAALQAQVKDLTDRKDRLKIFYLHAMSNMFDIGNRLETLRTGALAELQEIGMSEADLRRQASEYAQWYRGHTAQLFYDALRLYAMVEVESRVTEAAFKRYASKIDKLRSSSSSADVVSGGAAYYQVQLEAAERAGEDAFNRSRENMRAEAVMDPVKYTRDKLALVEDLVQRTARLCDFAMSGELTAPMSFSIRITPL